MIAIKGYKMPKDCINCVMQFGGWCGVSPPEVDERVAETVEDAINNGKPDWCPLVEIETEPVNRAEILRLCNEIEDEVTDIAFNSTHKHIYECCESIREYLKAIVKELAKDDSGRTRD